MSYIKKLKEKLNDENSPGAIIGGTGLKYIFSGMENIGIYYPEIKTLFIPIKKNQIIMNYKVIEKINNYETAKKRAFLENKKS